MFTCAKIKDGSTYLSSHLTANDYYCENEHVTGVWVGKGAERLGLSGDSIGKDDAAFEALRRNLLPDGSGRLTPRRAENGIRFFDFQCSAQKSVSIMAVTLEDPRLYAARPPRPSPSSNDLPPFVPARPGNPRSAGTSAPPPSGTTPPGLWILSFTLTSWSQTPPGIPAVSAGWPWIPAKSSRPSATPAKSTRTRWPAIAANSGTASKRRATRILRRRPCEHSTSRTRQQLHEGELANHGNEVRLHPRQ